MIITMKKMILSALVAFFAATAFASTNAGFAITDVELLSRVDALASYTENDYSAVYTIVQTKAGATSTKSVATLFRRDASQTYTIVITEPSISRGQGYLKQASTLFVYDPKSGSFNSTSNQDRFQNTNARNSDFTRSTLAEDYKVVGGENVRLGQIDCRLLTLEATATSITYPKMKIWVSEDGLVRKTEDYSLSGQHLRTSYITEYYTIKDKTREGRQLYVPKKILFRDALRGAQVNGKFVNEETQITITKPSFTKLPDSVFSKAFLETVNKK
jgi:hypothetical protein